jgi:putative tricarboxylic transport membrane protein
MNILNGFDFLFAHPMALLFVFFGAFIGTVAGAIPGMTAAAAIAMLVPVTFYLDPLTALAFLYVIGKSGRFGGSIAAILFNTPGTASSAATMQDGFPMTQQGKAGKALKTATVASVFGDTFGELILIFCASIIAVFTSRFGPPEYFAIYMMAFVVISSVIGKSIIKGLLSTLFGVLISLIGLDPIAGIPRMTMGIYQLESGLSLVPLLIGLFVISEVMVQAGNLYNEALHVAKTKSDDPDAGHLTWAEFKRCIPLMFRSSSLGAVIGMMPGLGAAVACFAAYGEGKRRSKSPEKWGTGIVEGIVAPESANNAVSGPSMIPLLTLGVPGSTIAAVLIGVFMIHGIQVGPLIFETNPDLIYGLFAAGLIGIASYGLIGYFCGPLIGRAIAYVPARLIYPFIFLIAAIACYSPRQSLFDIGVALVFGIIGYLMRRTKYSTAAFIIAFVLARGAENAFRQSLLLSDNGMGVFLERPIAIVFIAIGLTVLISRSISELRRKRRLAGVASANN